MALTAPELSKKSRILVVDDERLIRWSLCADLTERGYDALEAEDGRAAREAIERGVEVVVLDYRLPDMAGFDLLEEIRRSDPTLPVVMLTAHSSVDHAVEAMRRGAYHYVAKPFEIGQLLGVVEEAMAARSGQAPAAADPSAVEELVGQSPVMERLRSLILRVAASPATTILVTGESGTGKDVTARALHRASSRAEGPFVHLTCTALPPELVESELFGHARGAFTDAVGVKEGLLETADGGTVFLDEIGDLDPRVQAKLLRFLESRTFRRVGDVVDRHADVRIIAATHVNLQEAVAAGTFRQDLYYRLAVLTVETPPLRQRVEDVPALVDHFLRLFRSELGTRARAVTEDVLRQLCAHSWPGNVRELRNVLQRAAVVTEADILGIRDLPSLPQQRSVIESFPFPPEGIELDALERSLLRRALERTGGNRTRAARLLGITRNQIRYRIEKFGLDEQG